MAPWERLLEEVIRERRAALVSYACLYARDRLAAEDLVQEALVRVFSRTRTLTDPRAAEGYVRQAIRTTFLDQARKDRTWRGRRHLFAVDESTRGADATAAAGVDVRQALGTLTPRERACVVLRYFEDLAVAEIAAELGVGEGSVKRYLSDGTRKLRTTLGVHAGLDLDDDGPDAERVPVAPLIPLRGRSTR